MASELGRRRKDIPVAGNPYLTPGYDRVRREMEDEMSDEYDERRAEVREEGVQAAGYTKRTRKERMRSLGTLDGNMRVIAETLMNLEFIGETLASAPKDESEMLDEACTVLGELLAIFVYKPELKEQFGPREAQARRLLVKLEGRRS